MNVGDTVVFTGVVKDIVRSKDGPQVVSVLTASQALPGPSPSDGKEYWFDESHLRGVATQTELDAMATAAGFTLTPMPKPAATGEPPAHPVAAAVAAKKP